MRVIALILCLGVPFGPAVASTPEQIYFRIQPMIGNAPPLSDAGVVGGCYVGDGRECSGLFYMTDEGSGVFVGTVINDLVPNPEFELLYSITLSKEGGRDLLVGSAYAMQLSPEGEILSGRRTPIRQYFTYGDEIVLAQPVGKLANGETIFLQMSADNRKARPDDDSRSHPITLVSTQWVDGEQHHQVTNRYGRLSGTHAFRAGFEKPLTDELRDVLRYDVEVEVDCATETALFRDTDLVKGPRRCTLSLTRKYSIDTLHHSGAPYRVDVVYSSRYSRDVDILPGKMLKLIFPPDTPSVHGFDIEDTLIIVPE